MALGREKTKRALLSVNSVLWLWMGYCLFHGFFLSYLPALCFGVFYSYVILVFYVWEGTEKIQRWSTSGRRVAAYVYGIALHHGINPFMAELWRFQLRWLPLVGRLTWEEVYIGHAMWWPPNAVGLAHIMCGAFSALLVRFTARCVCMRC